MSIPSSDKKSPGASWKGLACSGGTYSQRREGHEANDGSCTPYSSLGLASTWRIRRIHNWHGRRGRPALVGQKRLGWLVPSDACSGLRALNSIWGEGEEGAGKRKPFSIQPTPAREEQGTLHRKKKEDVFEVFDDLVCIPQQQKTKVWRQALRFSGPRLCLLVAGAEARAAPQINSRRGRKKEEAGEGNECSVPHTPYSK